MTDDKSPNVADALQQWRAAERAAAVEEASDRAARNLKE
jgi:hypothetical protein